MPFLLRYCSYLPRFREIMFVFEKLKIFQNAVQQLRFLGQMSLRILLSC